MHPTGPIPPPAAHRARVMWIEPDRVFYAGRLGAPKRRTLGAICLYVALDAPIRVSVDGERWLVGDLVLVPPHLPHLLACASRHIADLLVEPETVDEAALPAYLRGGPRVVDAPQTHRRILQAHARLGEAGDAGLAGTSFDEAFFGAALAPRRLDTRIAAVVEAIRRDPSAPSAAQACAAAAGLSFSRFLHLFKDETGVSFRSLRTWKRARSLLRHVNRPSNLADVALVSGYPDSTHFSHSIRQVYGLTPRDLFAGSRDLVLVGREAVARGATVHA